jgi:hypothetical protein
MDKGEQKVQLENDIVNDCDSDSDDEYASPTYDELADLLKQYTCHTRALRNKAGCISYMHQEDNIYNNRVYRDKCHNNQSIYYIAEVLLQNKR